MTLGRTLRSTLDPTLRASLGGGLPWEQVEGGLLGLSLSTGGTFTRSTEGSYLTGAPTDGVLAFLAWAGVDVRRIEDRGDGLGRWLLLEGSRVNKLIRSRDLADAAWSAGSVAPTSNANAGPDGAGLADQENLTAAQFGNAQVNGSGTGLSAFSMWVRAVAGTAPHQFLAIDNGAALGAKATSVSTTYQRVDAEYTPATSAGIRPVDARDLTANGGQTAQAQNVYVDLIQIEPGAFPSSAIRTLGAAVTRGADLLSYAPNQYPASFVNRGFRFIVRPLYSSAELIAIGTQSRLVQMGASVDLVQFTASTSILRLFCSGGIVASSVALTFSRYQALTITVEPLAGRLTVQGASVGDGVYSGAGVAWPATALNLNPTGDAFALWGTTMVPV